MDRCQPQAGEQARECKDFESHFRFGSCTDESDQKRVGDRHCGHGDACRKTDNERQQEYQHPGRHMDAGEEIHDAADGAAGFEIEFEKQRPENQQDHVRLAARFEYRGPFIKGDFVQQQ